MKTIFLGTTPTIKLSVDQDVTGYNLAIIYRKPSGIYGTWIGTIDPYDLRSVNYVAAKNDFDEVGLWLLQAEILSQDFEERYLSAVVQVGVFYPVNTIPALKPFESNGILTHAHVSGSGV